MKNILSIFLLMLTMFGFFSSCNEKRKNESQIILDNFSEFPSDIDGCSCYFSSDSSDFNNHKFLYVDDYYKTAYLSINGVMTKFELERKFQPSKIRTTKRFKNNEFKLEIEMKEIGQIDETWQQIGILKLTSQKGKVIKKNILGECSC